MTRYTYRDGDMVEIYSTNVDAVVFRGTVDEFGEYKHDKQERQNEQGWRNQSQQTDYSPAEFVTMYEDNDWFITGPTVSVPESPTGVF